jgi:hypothetical protein
LQSILSDFKAIKMLRFPASDMPGGYEFWDWGKVTYRSQSFRDGRDYLFSIIRPYERATELIEQRLWFQVEKTEIPDGEGIKLTGTPVTFLFPEELPLTTFHNFIESTFDKGQGPFRLWGNPIRLGEKKVHVYGIDLHLWQRIYMELSPKRFIVVLPYGTCGNTVHRLVSNIQRYLSPDVETFIGEDRYVELLSRILLGEDTIQ